MNDRSSSIKQVYEDSLLLPKAWSWRSTISHPFTRGSTCGSGHSGKVHGECFSIKTVQNLSLAKVCGLGLVWMIQFTLVVAGNTAATNTWLESPLHMQLLKGRVAGQGTGQGHGMIGHWWG